MKRAIRMDQLYRMPARWRKSYKEDLELRGEPTQTIEIYNYSTEDYFITKNMRINN